MKSRDRRANFTKSSDQGLVQRGDQAACIRVSLSRTSIYKAFARISSDQGPFLSAIKAKFRQSKILIPVANGSTGATSVITPCIMKLLVEQRRSVRKMPR